MRGVTNTDIHVTVNMAGVSRFGARNKNESFIIAAYENVIIQNVHQIRLSKIKGFFLTQILNFLSSAVKYYVSNAALAAYRKSDRTVYAGLSASYRE